MRTLTLFDAIRFVKDVTPLPSIFCAFGAGRLVVHDDEAILTFGEIGTVLRIEESCGLL